MNRKCKVNFAVPALLAVLLAGCSAGGGAVHDPGVLAGAVGTPAAAPVLALPASVKVQEGVTATFLMPSATLAAGRSATWSISGTDAARFKIDAATGALSFRQAPDTARPADADAHNGYDLVVKASDGQRGTQAPLKVLVLPWNDGGAAGLPLPLVAREVARPAGTTGRPGLRVLDWAGFKAAVSYTFDDSQPSQIEHYPELKAQRVRVTYYINPAGNRYPNYDATWKDAVAQGSEIGNHTTHHCRAAELTDNDSNTCPAGLGSAGAEFDDTDNYIRTNIGQSAVWTMAYPFGDTDYKAAASRFLVARGVWPGMTAPGTASDALNLPITGFPGDPSTPGGDPVSTFNTAVDKALGRGRWMIYLFHTVLPAPTQNWGGGEDIGVITGNMVYAKSFGTMWIDSVVNIGAYWRGQQLLQAATPSTSGGVTTWRWTLPANFPAGRKLRVVVDGGALEQNGTPLSWDRHGYYEVSLDAQSLRWTR
ncbi:peptidoglycan/xylan/chitin deacetylase (PgdA/CDA1 family) [Duganella sp. 1411]|uniref:polysaccharide deacetylase family protein n=1 Tax=Duganella sp. 1411 TaxID=2806572 RepID=UPI001AE6DB0C|nr:polysaccharide deacetylase family protein [Duganella sp. 1411]MBP1203027.1 peptidoglycan/xylan/chitin deacetylase (PgdA/CDA1 family) [Duganella sp. 1411]